jgi:hypothetical protein
LEGTLIAFDCVHDAHESAQFTADTHRQLLETVLQHFDRYHPEVSEEAVNDLVNASAYDPEVRARTLTPLARSTEDLPLSERELAIADRSSP